MYSGLYCMFTLCNIIRLFRNQFFLLQLFEKLKVQETVALSAVERKGGDNLLKPDPHSSRDQTRSRTDPKHTQELSEKDRSTSKVTQQSESKPKVKYGRVHTRHVNQLFIRGENILLVNVQQD